MPNPYDVLIASASSSDEASEEDTFPEDAGSAMLHQRLENSFADPAVCSA